MITVIKRESKFAVKKWLLRKRIALYALLVVCLFSLLFYNYIVWDKHYRVATLKFAHTLEQWWYDALDLRLQHVYLEGHHHIDNQTIAKALKLDIGQPIVSIDLQELKARLERIGWIQSAVVERIFPNALHIHIIERKPFALWQTNGKLYLIDNKGHVLTDSNLSEFSNYLIIVGDDAPFFAESLMQMLSSKPEIYQSVSAAIRVGERRWNIRFKNGVEVKLPEENIGKAWGVVAKLHAQQKLFQPNVKSIDLRLADKMFIKTRPDSLPNATSKKIND